MVVASLVILEADGEEDMDEGVGGCDDTQCFVDEEPCETQDFRFRPRSLSRFTMLKRIYDMGTQDE